MDNLRLILLVLGVVVVAAIWAFEAWRRRRNAAAREDPFADFDSDDLAIDELPPWQEQPDTPEPAVSPVPAPAPGTLRPRAAGRHEPQPQDLFDDGREDDDGPPLGDLTPLVASRDDDARERGPKLSADFDARTETPPVSPDDGRGANSGASKRRAPQPAIRDPAPTVTPDAAPAEDADIETPRRVDPAAAASAAKQAERPATAETVVSLLIMARPGRRFVGHQVRAALESVGLRYGEMQIFHYHDDDEDDTPLFSAVNALKPGTFDLARLGELSTTGVALFMQVPGPSESGRVFELMLETARHLAERLGGDLGDAGRRPLSAARLEELRAIAAGEPHQ